MTNPDAPATPFDMPAYALAESAEALRWEEVAIAESAAADRAGDIADRYLLFTIFTKNHRWRFGLFVPFVSTARDLQDLLLGSFATKVIKI
jgi:hypothetical protein